MEPTANAGMSVSDWSSLVAMVVAICALFSPALTAFFNNQHQLEMKKLEYEHQEREAQQKREREIYEGYIRAAGAAIQYQTKESIQTFGEHSALAMYYVPEELRADMVLLEKLAQRRESYDDLLVRKVELLNRIISTSCEVGTSFNAQRSASDGSLGFLWFSIFFTSFEMSTICTHSAKKISSTLWPKYWAMRFLI